MQENQYIFCLDKKCDLPSRVASSLEEVLPHWQRKHENAVDLNGLHNFIDKESHPLHILMTQYDYRDQMKFIRERVKTIRQVFKEALVKLQNELTNNLSGLQEENKFIVEMFIAIKSRKIDEVLKFKDRLALLHEDSQPVMMCLQRAQTMWSSTNLQLESIQRNILEDNLGRMVKYPKFRWSEQKKCVTITIEGNKVINQANWGMALLEPALGRDDVCSVFLKRTNIDVSSPGGTTFALVNHNRLQKSHPQYTGDVQEGDGFYGMCGLGQLFFHHPTSIFSVRRGFYHLPNDTVQLTWNGPKQRFILSNDHEGTRKTFEFPVKFEGKSAIHFAVYLSKNKVELLE